MLPPKYIAFIVFIWVVGSIMGGVLEYSQLGNAEGAALNPILSWQEYSSEEDFGILQMAGVLPAFFQSLFNMLTLQFSFISGDWAYIRWIVLAPIIAIVIYGVAMVMIGILRRAV